MAAPRSQEPAAALEYLISNILDLLKYLEGLKNQEECQAQLSPVVEQPKIKSDSMISP